MKINDDFNQRVVIDTNRMDWVNSPMPGVERKMLDRIGAESGHATSIVRYAPESAFSAHTHHGGESFLVLSGVFSDEHNDYPAGTYVRNPVGTSHTPFSKKGCVIFVKLWQFEVTDTRQFHIDTNGDRTKNLHVVDSEQVTLVSLKPGEHYVFQSPVRRFEILILSGSIIDSHNEYETGYWLRNPGVDAFDIQAGLNGARFFLICVM